MTNRMFGLPGTTGGGAPNPRTWLPASKVTATVRKAAVFMAGSTRAIRASPGSSAGDFLRAFAAVDEEEHGHAHGQAVGDLLEDHGAAAIGDFAVNLDTAVDGAGMHDERIGLGERQSLL